MKLSRKDWIRTIVASSLGAFVWLLFVKSGIETVSPDGRYTARVTRSGALPDLLLANTTIHVKLIDNATGRIVRRDYYTTSGGLAGGSNEEPVKILWSKDSQWFCYIYNQYDLFRPHLHTVYSVSRWLNSSPPDEIVKDFDKADPHISFIELDPGNKL